MAVEAPFAGRLGARAPAPECRLLKRWTAPTNDIAMCHIAVTVVEQSR